MDEAATKNGHSEMTVRLAKGDHCVICTAESDKDRVGLDACNHMFCFNCIWQWSQVENSCPLCRRRFRLILAKSSRSVGSQEFLSIRMHPVPQRSRGCKLVEPGRDTAHRLLVSLSQALLRCLATYHQLHKLHEQYAPTRQGLVSTNQLRQDVEQEDSKEGVGDKSYHFPFTRSEVLRLDAKLSSLALSIARVNANYRELLVLWRASTSEPFPLLPVWLYPDGAYSHPLPTLME